MKRFRLPIALILAAFNAACSNMAPADKADSIFPGAHEFGSTAVAFSPNGQFVVTGGYQGDVKLWDVQKRQIVASAKPHAEAVRAIAINGNSMFATASDDGNLFLWVNGKTHVRNTGTPATSLAWFQGRLISGHGDKQLKVWDKALQETGRIPVEEDIVSLATHRERLAVAMNSRILILDAKFTTKLVLDTDGATPHDLQFSPDGKTLAAGGWFRLHVWDLASGDHRSISTEHGGLVTSVSFSPDGKHIATLGRNTDSAIRIMDTQYFQVERRYQSHELCGAMIRYSPDGRWLVSASDDESVRFYDMSRSYSPGKSYDKSFGETPEIAPTTSQKDTPPSSG
jgi:WD40 repeat protein